jgi:hypothetical protein
MTSQNAVFQMFVDKMGGRHIEDFIGDKGLIFYDPGVGELRIGDGVTPKGLPVFVSTIGINYDGGSSSTLFGVNDYNYDGGSSSTFFGSSTGLDGGTSLN